MKTNTSHNIPILNTVSRVDPTRTTALRNTFIRDANKRFNELMRAIRITIVDNDAFGLTNETPPSPRLVLLTRPIPAPPDAFDFPRTERKVRAFMNWLDVQQEAGVLEIIRKPGGLRGLEEAWTDTYIHSSYQKGLVSSRRKMHAQDPSIPLLDANDNLAMNAVMNQPIHADRLGALYTRTFSELEGVTRAMDTQISRVLTEGLIEGVGPRQLAYRVNDRVKKIGLTRARTIARTEVIRAHHVATIQEYEQWGVEGIKVKAEWVTAGVGVCERCAPREAKIYTLDQVYGLIPLHPNCRCTTIPVDFTSKDVKSVSRRGVPLSSRGVPMSPRTPARTQTFAPRPGTRTFPREITGEIPPASAPASTPTTKPKRKTTKPKSEVTKPKRRPTKRKPTKPKSEKPKPTSEKPKPKSTDFKWKDGSSTSDINNKLYDIGATSSFYGEGAVAIRKGNQVGSELTRMYNRHPKIADLTRKNPVSLDIINNRLIDGDATGQFSKIKNQMQLAGKYNSKGRFTLSSKSWHTDSGALGTIRHEYGHSIFRKIPKEQRRKWFDVYTRNKHQLSEYGRVDFDEGFAEAFSAFTHPQYGVGAKKYKGELHEFFTEVFGA